MLIPRRFRLNNDTQKLSVIYLVYEDIIYFEYWFIIMINIYGVKQDRIIFFQIQG